MLGLLCAGARRSRARLCGDVRGHGALCLVPGCLLETYETLRAGRRALRRRLTLERRVRPRFSPKKGGTDSQPSALLRPVAEVRGPRDALFRPARALAVAESGLRAVAGAFVSTKRALHVAGRALVSLEDVLLAPARVLFDGKRVRRTPECVLQAVQDVRPHAQEALVTTENAFLVAADALVGPAH